MLRKLLFGIAALAGVGFAPSAQAVVFTLEEFTGSDASATIDVTQSGDDLQFNVQVVSPDFADIRGVFFNVADDSLLAGLSASGGNVTGFEANPQPGGGGISGDALVTPASFEFGVEIGASGIGGGDDFHSTIFTISHATALDVNTFFEAISGNTVGLRLTSVGTSADNRRGSSKLTDGGPPPTPAPEPATLLLLGAGLLGLGIVRRRKAA